MITELEIYVFRSIITVSIDSFESYLYDRLKTKCITLLD